MISTARPGKFASQDCPFFKVDIDFKAAEDPGGETSETNFLDEEDTDIILKISRPYLQFGIMD